MTETARGGPIARGGGGGCELAEFPKPVIAAVNGPAAGLGFALAMSCDIRFAAADAELTTSFARLGLVAEHRIAWLLPRLVGGARARDLLLSVAP